MLNIKFLHRVGIYSIVCCFTIQVSYGVMMLAVFLTIDILLHLLCSVLCRPLPSPHTPTPSPATPPSQRHSGNTVKHVRCSNVCFVSAVDFNQLGFFFLANIFTGLVNFSVDTLNTVVTLSVVILVLYMACLMAVFLMLHRLNIKIKL